MSSLFTMSIWTLISASVISVGLGTSAHADSDIPAAPASASSTDGLRVSIDPVTKRIRPLTPSEADALGAAAATAAKAPRAETVLQGIVSRTTGARGIVMGPEHMSYSRAAIGANGKLATDCVDGDDAADVHEHPVHTEGSLK
ncbi:hypothetical protein LRH25_09870 [Ideonella azotifigens]|uniref:DUF4148 domain-containing protein n=1 Tax=Ideonella azotifigens TaxID=513160 RepID=A0ABN1KFJ5_9BURK|nr:hypothetical protein [Ideonella azotifigens]MCD2340650.1 hypothetical protein [Ideonella azotifigens]